MPFVEQPPDPVLALFMLTVFSIAVIALIRKAKWKSSPRPSEKSLEQIRPITSWREAVGGGTTHHRRFGGPTWRSRQTRNSPLEATVEDRTLNARQQMFP